ATASGFAAFGASLPRAATLAASFGADAGAALRGASSAFSARQPASGLSLYWILPRASTHLYIWAYAGSARASSKAAMSDLMDNSVIRPRARQDGVRGWRHPYTPD